MLITFWCKLCTCQYHFFCHDGFSVNNTIYHDCWFLIIQLKLQIISGWLNKTRSMVLLRLPCCLVGSFMNCVRLYSWVSSIDFFEGKERLAEALRLSHEIFRAFKLPKTITLCLWILSPNLSTEASSLSRLFTLWRVKSDLEFLPVIWHWLWMISWSVSRSTQRVAMISPFIAWKTLPPCCPLTLSFLKMVQSYRKIPELTIYYWWV